MSDQSTELYTAAREGRTDVVKELLTHSDIDVNKGSNAGDTPLYTAARWGRTDVVKELLSRSDIDVNKEGESGTPLCVAVEKGNTDVVKELLSRSDIDVNKQLDNKQARHVFCKSSVFKILVDIFVRPKDDGTQLSSLLNVLYVSLQANITCDCGEDEPPETSSRSDLNKVESPDPSSRSDLSKVALKFLQKTLGVDGFTTFSDRIDAISLEGYKDDIDAKLVAISIKNTFLKDNGPGCCAPIENVLEDIEKCLFSACISKLSHKCTVQGSFAYFTCFFGIFIYISDIASDVYVGFKTLNGFSSRLGILMLVIVFVTLFHENIRSSLSTFATGKEKLQTIRGKYKLTIVKDWKGSELNHNGYLERFFWPFKVKGRTSIATSVRAVVFNVFSICWLRPVVDRLQFLTHSPSKLRVIYMQQAKDKSLAQYYMIMEQIPELLIQFYIFQIYFNNLGVDLTSSHTCTDNHSFRYNSSDFECVQNLLKLKICASWVEVYSMLVPFVKIPNSVISLEVIFRKLHPATPKMSTVALVLLYIAYVLMIPSRLFLFAALMHSVPDHYYVFGYLVLSTLLWLFFNMFTVSRASKHEKRPSSKDKEDITILRRIGDMWSLLLFSFRDIIVTSLRRPNAYLISPSEVGYKTLRTWKEMMLISSYMFVEGVIAAVYVENNYPCGRNTDVFKYQGWFCLILLIISTTLITLLSYIFQVDKKHFKSFRMKSAFICGYGLMMWLIAGLTWFICRTRHGLIDRILVIIIFVILMIIFLVAVILLRQHGELAKLPKKVKSEEQKQQASACCPISNFIKSSRSRTASDDVEHGKAEQPEKIQLLAQNHSSETETGKDTEEENSYIQAQNAEA